MRTGLSIIQGDITEIKVDVIVNAANESLLGGSGVDGAIHKAAGPKLLKECKRLKGCSTGEAKVTRGYNLPAKWVIHTVGPIWNNGTENEDELLASCYRESLALAVEIGAKTIAFPSISTGVYKFPINRAAKIAIDEIEEFLANDITLEEVIAVCFDEQTFNTYKAIKNMANE